MLDRTAACVLVAGLVLAGSAACGGTDAKPAPEDQPVATPRPSATSELEEGDPARYCALTRQLEAQGHKAFAGLGHDATAAEYRQAERRFLTDNAAALRQLESSLPESLRDEMRTFLAGMRERAGLPVVDLVTQREVSSAEKALRDFEKREC